MKKKLKPSTEGYRADSPDRNNPMNFIPSGHISMRGVPHSVFGVDNLGNQRIMHPGDNDYFFPGNSVMEFPVKRTGGTFSNYIFQDGGEAGIDPETAKQMLQESQDLTDEQRTYLAQIAGTDEYGNELENVDEDIQEDESMEEYKKGGDKKTSHKNIQRNRNELFKRNYDAFGEAGVKNYKPKLEDGGGLTDSFLKKTIDLHTAELQKKSKPENNIQSTTTDSYIAGKQDQFSKYLKANLMSNLVKEEHQFMLQPETRQIMKMGGANLLKFTAKYQMGGGQPDLNNMTREQLVQYMANPMNGKTFPQQTNVGNPIDMNSIQMQGQSAPSVFGDINNLQGNQLIQPAPRDGYGFFPSQQYQSGDQPPYEAGKTLYMGPSNTPYNNQAGMDWRNPQSNPSMTGNQAYGYNPTMMPDYQMQNQPNTSIASDDQLYNSKAVDKPNWWQAMSGEDKAMLAVSGLNLANNLLETNAANRRQHQLDNKLDSNSIMGVRPANGASRGDYDTNSGILRPDRYVPVQFAGNQNMRAGYYKHGGTHKPGDEIEMSEAEIAAYIANGGKIERI